MKDFGERLRELREHKGWSQRQLGEKIHRTKNMIYRYENGIQEPTLDVLLELSALLGVSIGYLSGVGDESSLMPSQQELLTLLQNTLEEMATLTPEEKYHRLKTIETQLLREFD